MIKKFAIKKFMIISLSFIILLLLYLFPESDKYKINTTLTYIEPKTIPIYLVDNNNYVSRFEVIRKSENTLDLVDEIIDNLTIGYNDGYIPNNFKKIIPKNTTILSKELENSLLKINFSKELLNVDIKSEEKMLEAIIYSLTEIKDIKKIMIFVEGNNLKELPNSKKKLPLVLDRNYGINKVYDLNSMKNINKVTTYYVSKNNNLTYYTPITCISNDKDEKIKIIIEKLKTNPTYNTNLVSYLKTSAELQNYEILENSVNLSFNNKILALDDDKIIEEVKYSIALSVKDSYQINETIFYVDNNLIDVLII